MTKRHRKTEFEVRWPTSNNFADSEATKTIYEERIGEYTSSQVFNSLTPPRAGPPPEAPQKPRDPDVFDLNPPPPTPKSTADLDDEILF